MKTSLIDWLKDLARQADGHPPAAEPTPLFERAVVYRFLDEICDLALDCAAAFNALIRERHPELTLQSLQIGHPRAGIVLLRASDKLVLEWIGGRVVRGRVLETHPGIESLVHVVTFAPRLADDDDVVWICTDDEQMVNPELAFRRYLGSFLLHGCRGFAPRRGLPVQKEPTDHGESHHP